MPFICEDQINWDYFTVDDNWKIIPKVYPDLKCNICDLDQLTQTQADTLGLENLRITVCDTWDVNIDGKTVSLDKVSWLLNTATPPIMWLAWSTTVTNIWTTTADLTGTYTSDWGSPVTATWFVVYPSGNPSTVIWWAWVIQFPDVILPSPINVTATWLSSWTNYCCKPYATNAIGTSYGVEVCFITSIPPATLLRASRNDGVLTKLDILSSPTTPPILTSYTISSDLNSCYSVNGSTYIRWQISLLNQWYNLNISSWTVTNTWSLQPSWVTKNAMSVDWSKIVLWNWSTWWIYNATTWVLITTITGAFDWRSSIDDFTWSLDWSSIYYTNNTNQVRKIDASTWVSSAFATLAWGNWFANNFVGNKLYCACSDNNLYVFDTTTGASITTISVWWYVRWIEVDHNTWFVYAWHSTQIRIIDSSTDTITATISWSSMVEAWGIQNGYNWYVYVADRWAWHIKVIQTTAWVWYHTVVATIGGVWPVQWLSLS